MPQIIFTFTVNTDTQEAAIAGNIEPQVALQILQQLVIANAIKQARQQEIKDKEETVEGTST